MRINKGKEYYASLPKFVGFLAVCVLISLAITGAFNVADGRPVFDRLVHSIVFAIVLGSAIAQGARLRAWRGRRRASRHGDKP